MTQPKSLKPSIVNLFYHDRASEQWIRLPRIGVYTHGNVASIEFESDSISIIQEQEGNQCVLRLEKPNYTLISLHVRPRGKGSCISAEFACRTLPRESLASKHGQDGLKKAIALPLSMHHSKMMNILKPRNWEFVGTNRPPTSDALKRRIKRLCTSPSSCGTTGKRRSRLISRTPLATDSDTSSDTESATDPDPEPDDDKQQADSDSSEDPVTKSPNTRRAETRSTTQNSISTAAPKRPQFTDSKPKQRHPATNSTTKNISHPAAPNSQRHIIRFPTPPKTIHKTLEKRPLWEVDAELDDIEQGEEAFLAKSRAAKLHLERKKRRFWRGVGCGKGSWRGSGSAGLRVVRRGRVLRLGGS
ncbi:MAG: hypothetical protein Q9207_005644 [Kuettlingeria erythrocarpa]